MVSSGIFGSDFSMIGKVLFHGNRDRRQVKNKFKLELKLRAQSLS